MAGGSAPRFAPDDPSLPPPWKALVDGNTGYIYYWNTDTNVTQYEKPSASSGVPPLPPGPPPAPSLSGVTPKQAALPGVPSSDSKSLEKRSSASSGMSPGSGSNNPNRIEDLHSMVSPMRVSGSGNRFLSSGGHLSAALGDFPDGLYGSNSNAPNQQQRSYSSEHQDRHMPEHHSRYMSDHHSRSSTEHHGGHTSGRSTSDHHGGHLSDLRSRSIPEPRHLTNHDVPDHHGGHMYHHHNRPPMPEHHSGQIGLTTPKSSHTLSGSGSRSSGHGMPAGGMHTNSSNSAWGASSGRHSHGSPIGFKGALSSRSDHDVGGARSIPKLAAPPIPQRQQVLLHVFCGIVSY
ncbi:hypothetical protein L7F22_052441 [Adiantum nelumboides]|nr:hypothetical protein [Adiantum nelumboides]